VSDLPTIMTGYARGLGPAARMMLAVRVMR
jgi:hypothetical protein